MNRIETSQNAARTDKNAAIVARLQALAEAHAVPGMEAAHKAVEWHREHSEQPARFARIAYLSALAFGAICKRTPLSVLETHDMSRIIESDRRYQRNYDLLARLVEKGCILRGELPAPKRLHLPAGLACFAVGAADLPLCFEHPPRFTDIQAGDVLLVLPNDEGQYVAERDGQTVIVGTVRGYVRGEGGITAPPQSEEGRP